MKLMSACRVTSVSRRLAADVRRRRLLRSPAAVVPPPLAGPCTPVSRADTTLVRGQPQGRRTSRPRTWLVLARVPAAGARRPRPRPLSRCGGAAIGRPQAHPPRPPSESDSYCIQGVPARLPLVCPIQIPPFLY
ncbi:hypothetical protein SORBI_3010G172300 [Sorghum bicolor]|uniref:Uncharacterized protein n=1 Tax=Sorghum bicolor TaxID=4558 RepID=A0A194YJU6_SORBI|nr:hypothetical protein SORBI_3010G172300 [Sorghum bicolor]